MSFLDAFVEMKDEYIFLPHNVIALKRTMKSYESVGLPGACGSIDVVHIKWATCPPGDHNRAKGKEGYTTVAFQCITDYNRRFLVFLVHSLGHETIRRSSSSIPTS